MSLFRKASQNQSDQSQSQIPQTNQSANQAGAYQKQLNDYYHALGNALSGGLAGAIGMYPGQIINAPSASHLLRVYAELSRPQHTEKIAALKKASPRRIVARVPDYVQPITGWRAWHSDGQKLFSLNQTYADWKPKERVVANCKAKASSLCNAPAKDCTCGIWSFRDVDTLEAALGPYGFNVIGSVALWGRVIECENGWRAEFAYPTELWLMDKSHEQLGYIYGVPVRTLD